MRPFPSPPDAFLADLPDLRYSIPPPHLSTPFAAVDGSLGGAVVGVVVGGGFAGGFLNSHS